MKNNRVFKLKDLIGGITIKEGMPLKVPRETVINAFKEMGIDIKDSVYVKEDSISISLKWADKDFVELKFYRNRPYRS